MAEQACPDPPKKGGCRFEPDHILTDPEFLPGGYPLYTVVLTRQPSEALLPLLEAVRRVELSWRAPWLELAVPWTFFLDELVLGDEDDLYELEMQIAQAAVRGADHVLVSLARQDPAPDEEYLQRLLGLIRSLCDEAGLTFAVQIPGARVNQYLASSTCCRWPTKG